MLRRTWGAGRTQHARAALALAMVAAFSLGAIELTYEGSFKPASPEPCYTAFTIAFAPAGNTRLGDPVSGPSVVIGWEQRTDGGYTSPVRVREVVVPATLAKTPAQLTTTIGAYAGTAVSRLPYTTPKGPYDIDSAGNFWGPAAGNEANWGGNGLLSSPGIWMLGKTGDVPALTVPETSANWAGMGWCRDGLLRRSNGSGVLLPTDGTKNGATFITADDDGCIRQDIRINDGGNTFSKSDLFKININNPGASPDLHPGVRDLSWRVKYVRDTAASEWFVVFWPSQNTGTNKSSILHFFPGNTTGGGLVAPVVSLDIDAMIAGGAGYTTGQVSSGPYSIREIAVDWANSSLYVLDSLGYGKSNIHVFKVKGASSKGTMVLFQ